MEMKHPTFVSYIILVAALAMAALLAKTMAAEMTGKEMPLNPEGEAYELFRDEQGNLWISDVWAGEIWRVNPTKSTYTVFEDLEGATDGQTDNSGDLWWGDFENGMLGQVTLETVEGTLWSLSEGASPLSIAFEDDDRIWVIDAFEPELYRFNTVKRELCAYAIPDEGVADTILYHDSKIWLGDAQLGRILTFNSTDDLFTIWQLADNAVPTSLEADNNGRLWWTDIGRGELGQLDQHSNFVTTYAIPGNVPAPLMLAIEDGKVWYTEENGTIGVLDPTTVSGNLTKLSPATAPTSKTCGTVEKEMNFEASTREGTVDWNSTKYPLILDSHGWLVYGLPAGAFPWGLAVDGNNIWFVDQGDGDQRLQQLGWLEYVPLSEEFHILLPIITR